MRHILKYYTQPAFLICVVVLASAAIGMSFLKNYFGLWLEKEPIPLKKPLDLLDEQRLKPFKLMYKQKIESKEIVKSLGTEDYLQWVLLDAEAPEESNAKLCTLFVTYYEKPDAVPHVPEECYKGGGFEQISSTPVTFEVDLPAVASDVSTASATSRRIPGRYVLFGLKSTGLPRANSKFPVLYFFNVNGRYVNTRTQARIELGKNIRGRYSYFSKVEVVFDQGSSAPDKQEAIETAEKLLSIVLPILEQEYWPDLNEAEKTGDGQQRMPDHT